MALAQLDRVAFAVQRRVRFAARMWGVQMSNWPSRGRRLLSGAVAMASSLGLAACEHVFGTPQFGEPIPYVHASPAWKGGASEPWAGPGEEVMIDHLTCRLIDDYARNVTWDDYNDDTHNAWVRLSRYHFVAAVALNLVVANAESVNPSLNFITPLFGNGGKNPSVNFGVPTPAGVAATATSTTFNYTLAVSGQFSGTQTNNVTLSYQLDMQRIAAAALASQKGKFQTADLLVLALYNQLTGAKPGDWARLAAAYTNDRECKQLAGIDDVTQPHSACKLEVLWSNYFAALINQAADKTAASQTIDANIALHAKEAIRGIVAPVAAREAMVVEGEQAAGDLVNWCDQETPIARSLEQTLKGDLLQGDLALESDIGNNLHGLDAVSNFNIYGSTGPASVNDVGLGPASDAAIAATTSSLNYTLPLPVVPGVTAAPIGRSAPSAGGAQAGGGQSKPGAGGQAQGGGAPATTSFSTIVTFMVSAGGGGGPSWSLLELKGPGGGGGGGGAGGAASGGAGGGGQLANVSRSLTDTLTVTYAPTCRTNDEYVLASLGAPAPVSPAAPAAPATPAATPGNYTWGLTVDPQRARPGRSLKGSFWSMPVALAPPAPPHGRPLPQAPKSPVNSFDWTFTVGAPPGTTSSIPAPTAEIVIAPSAGAALTPSGVNSVTGSITLKGVNGVLGVGVLSGNVYFVNGAADAPGHWQLNLVVTNPQNQAAIGAIELHIPATSNAATTVDGSMQARGRISDDVETKLANNTPTASYWETIPGCDIATGNYIQTAVQNAAIRTLSLTTQSLLPEVLP
jgi:hypothetical protein